MKKKKKKNRPKRKNVEWRRRNWLFGWCDACAAAATAVEPQPTHPMRFRWVRRFKWIELNRIQNDERNEFAWIRSLRRLQAANKQQQQNTKRQIQIKIPTALIWKESHRLAWALLCLASISTGIIFLVTIILPNKSEENEMQFNELEKLWMVACGMRFRCDERKMTETF